LRSGGECALPWCWVDLCFRVGLARVRVRGGIRSVKSIIKEMWFSFHVDPRHSIKSPMHERACMHAHILYHGERQPITFECHTLECKVRSERVKGSAREVRPLNSRRARGCTSGSAAKNISELDTSLIAWSAALVSARACQLPTCACARAAAWALEGHLLRVGHAGIIPPDAHVVAHRLGLCDVPGSAPSGGACAQPAAFGTGLSCLRLFEPAPLPARLRQPGPALSSRAHETTNTLRERACQ